METAAAEPAANPMRAVFAFRDFMLLWTGQSTSILGDQVHGIAAAWLVLKLTNDPLALGMVLAIGGIPRAVFIAVGGAISDRFSPRRIMLTADIIRLGLSALLAVQVFTGTLQVWMIYLYALAYGVVGGAFGPAAMSIIPRLLPEKNLQAGNALAQGSAQLIGFIGPAAAGGLIAAFNDVYLGIAIAIAFDALTFVVSVVTLWLMRSGDAVDSAVEKTRPADVLKSVRDGFGYMFHDPVLRMMFLIIALANFAFGGPVVVGIPYLADTRFTGGAAAYGIIIAGYSGGNLLGIILAGALPRFPRNVMRIYLQTTFFVFALGIAAVTWIPFTWLATTDMAVMGLMNGYITILFITALQRRTSKDMLGRIMSMVLLANMCFMPLSQAISGAVLRWNVIALFAGAGALLLTLAFYLVFSGAGGLLSDQLASEKHGAIVA